jgi:anti-anti-sigma factor
MDPRSRRTEEALNFDGYSSDVGRRLRAELHLRPTVAILTVHGEIDTYTRNRWRDILDSALDTAQGCGRLVVDVSDAGFIGFGQVFDLVRGAQGGTARGIQVAVIDPRHSVLDRILTVTGLTEWRSVYTDPTQMPSEDSFRPGAWTAKDAIARTDQSS